MANKTITSANAQLVISIPGLGIGAAPIQGFAADSAFQNEAIKAGEVTMGVDGIMSAAYVPAEIKLKISLSADSPSKQIFDDWFLAVTNSKDQYFASLILALPSTGEAYTFTRGIMTQYHGAPSGKKKLEPVEYELTFQNVSKSS